VILYTCAQEKNHANLAHPCGRAAKAIGGSGIIVDWAKAHPTVQPEVGGG
jgi:hypothetical protein